MIFHHRRTALVAVLILSVASGAQTPNPPASSAGVAVATPVGQASSLQTPGSQTADAPAPNLQVQAQAPQAPAPQAPSPQRPPAASPVPAEGGQESPNELSVTVGKSLIVSTAQPIQRISVGYNDVAEATAVSPREVLVNGKAPGQTSLIVWEQGGNKLFFDLIVRPNNFLSEVRLDGVRRELKKELPAAKINLSLENETVFLRGTVDDLTSADRAAAIASTLGKTVNLLYVNVPPPEKQILLKVRFASMDRSIINQLGLNLISTGATNTIGAVTTGQFSPPSISATGKNATVTLQNALNIFLFRPDLNLAATIEALESRGLTEILAEPNVLAVNGRLASFLAGGEFPYPILQGGGGGIGTVTIAFREFGVRINFIPTITPRGTIRLDLAPEVSALDTAQGLVFQGVSIPGLTVRRVRTNIELASGQSFAIGGLLDRRLTETINKIPLLGDIPILGKIFRSRSLQKNNTELIVLVTPELVRPIPEGQPTPELNYPKAFMEKTTAQPLRTPGMDVTGPVPVTPPHEAIPLEQMIQSLRQPRLETGPNASGLPDSSFQPAQELPFPQLGTPAPAPPAPTPAPAAPPK
jgi:pilus assembly protein CpaC